MSGRAINNMPAGVTDILLDDAQLKHHVESSLREVFEAWGYVEVVTPTFECYEVLLAGGIDPEWMYKFSDPDGGILALRPDLTTPIARVVATRLREAPKPLRLFYVENVFRRPQPTRGKCAEFSQAGIELVGSIQPAADAEVVATAIEALQRLGIDDFQLNLGQIGFFQGVIEDTTLSEPEITVIKERLDRRDREELARFLQARDLPDDKKRLILEILTLCGGEEVIERALTLADNKTSEAALENLAEIYRILGDYHLADRVVVDLAEVRGFGYYTGLMFEGFSRSLGSSIAKGGRYDDLIAKFGYPCPAVGCAFDIDRIRTIVQKEKLVALPKVDALVRFSREHRREAFELVKTLHAQGKRAELEVVDRSEEDAIAYARRKGVTELIVLDAGEKRVVPLKTSEIKDRQPKAVADYRKRGDFSWTN